MNQTIGPGIFSNASSLPLGQSAFTPSSQQPPPSNPLPPFVPPSLPPSNPPPPSNPLPPFVPPSLPPSNPPPPFVPSTLPPSQSNTQSSSFGQFAGSSNTQLSSSFGFSPNPLPSSQPNTQPINSWSNTKTKNQQQPHFASHSNPTNPWSTTNTKNQQQPYGTSGSHPFIGHPPPSYSAPQTFSFNQSLSLSQPQLSTSTIGSSYSGPVYTPTLNIPSGALVPASPPPSIDTFSTDVIGSPSTPSAPAIPVALPSAPAYQPGLLPVAPSLVPGGAAPVVASSSPTYSYYYTPVVSFPKTPKTSLTISPSDSGAISQFSNNFNIEMNAINHYTNIIIDPANISQTPQLHINNPLVIQPYDFFNRALYNVDPNTQLYDVSNLGYSYDTLKNDLDIMTKNAQCYYQYFTHGKKLYKMALFSNAIKKKLDEVRGNYGIITANPNATLPEYYEELIKNMAISFDIMQASEKYRNYVRKINMEMRALGEQFHNIRRILLFLIGEFNRCVAIANNHNAVGDPFDAEFLTDYDTYYKNYDAFESASFDYFKKINKELFFSIVANGLSRDIADLLYSDSPIATRNQKKEEIMQDIIKAKKHILSINTLFDLETKESVDIELEKERNGDDEDKLEISLNKIHQNALLTSEVKAEQIRTEKNSYLSKKGIRDDIIMKKEKEKERIQNEIMEKINAYFDFEKGLWFSERKEADGIWKSMMNVFVNKRNFQNTYESLIKQLMQYFNANTEKSNVMQCFIIKNLIDGIYELLCINNIMRQAYDIKRGMIDHFMINIHSELVNLEQEAKDMKKRIIEILIKSILMDSASGGPDYRDLDSYMVTHLRKKKETRIKYSKLKIELDNDEKQRCAKQSLIQNAAPVYYVSKKTCEKYNYDIEYSEYYEALSLKLVEQSSEIINQLGGAPPNIGNLKKYMLERTYELYRSKLFFGSTFYLLQFFMAYKKNRKAKKDKAKDMKRELYCFENLDDMYKNYYGEINERITKTKQTNQNSLSIENLIVKTSQIKIKNAKKQKDEIDKKLDDLKKIMAETDPKTLNYPELNMKYKSLEKEQNELASIISKSETEMASSEQEIIKIKKEMQELTEKEARINYGFFNCKIANEQITRFLNKKEELLQKKEKVLRNVYKAEQYVKLIEKTKREVEEIISSYKNQKMTLDDAEYKLANSPLRLIFRKSTLVGLGKFVLDRNYVKNIEDHPESMKEMLESKKQNLYIQEGAYEAILAEYAEIDKQIEEIFYIMEMDQKYQLSRMGAIELKPLGVLDLEFLKERTYSDILKRVGMGLFESSLQMINENVFMSKKITSLCVGAIEASYHQTLHPDTFLFGGGIIDYKKIENVKEVLHENVESMLGASIQDSIEWMQYHSYIKSRSQILLNYVIGFDGIYYRKPDGTYESSLGQIHINHIKRFIQKKTFDAIEIVNKMIKETSSPQSVLSRPFVRDAFQQLGNSLSRLSYYYTDLPRDAIANFISRSRSPAEHTAKDQENILIIRQYLEEHGLKDADNAALVDAYESLKLVYPFPRSSDLPAQNREQEKLRYYNNIIQYYENILLKDKEYKMVLQLREYCIAPIQDMISKRNTSKHFTKKKWDPYIFFDNKKRMTGPTTKEMSFEDAPELKLMYVLHLNNPYFIKCMEILSNVFECIDVTLEDMELHKIDPYYDWKISEKLYYIFSSPTRPVKRWEYTTGAWGTMSSPVEQKITPLRESDTHVVKKINKKVDYIINRYFPIIKQCVDYLKSLEDEIIKDTYPEDDFLTEEMYGTAINFSKLQRDVSAIASTIVTFKKAILLQRTDDENNPILFNNSSLTLKNYSVWNFDPNAKRGHLPCIRYDVAYRYMKMMQYHISHPRNTDTSSYLFHPFNLSLINGYYEQEDAEKNKIIINYRKDLTIPKGGVQKYKIGMLFDQYRRREKEIVNIVNTHLKDASVKMNCKYHLTSLIYIIKLYGKDPNFTFDGRVYKNFYDNYAFSEDHKKIIEDYLHFIRDTDSDYNYNISLLSNTNDATSFLNIPFHLHDLVYHSIQMQIYYRWRDFLTKDAPYTVIPPPPTHILPFCNFHEDELSVPFGFEFYQTQKKDILTDKVSYYLEMFSVEKQYYYLGICGREISADVEKPAIENKFIADPLLSLAKNNWVTKVLHNSIDQSISKLYGICKNFTFSNSTSNREYILSIDNKKLVCFLIFVIKSKKDMKDIDDISVDVYGIFAYHTFPKKIFFLGQTKINKKLLDKPGELSKERFFEEMNIKNYVNIESFLYNTISLLKRDKAIVILYNDTNKKIMHLPDIFSEKDDLAIIKDTIENDLSDLERWMNTKETLQQLVNDRKAFNENQKNQSLLSYAFSFVKKSSFDESRYPVQIREYAKTKSTYVAAMEKIEKKIREIQQTHLYKSIFITCINEMEIANKEKRLESVTSNIITKKMLEERKEFVKNMDEAEMELFITTQWKSFFKEGESKIKAIVDGFNQTIEEDKKKYKLKPETIPAKMAEEKDENFRKLFLKTCEEIIQLFPKRIPKKNKVYIEVLFNNEAMYKNPQHVLETSIPQYETQVYPIKKNDTTLGAVVPVYGKYKNTNENKYRIMQKNIRYNLWFLPKDYTHLDNIQSACYSIPIYFDDIASYLEGRYYDSFMDKNTFEITKNIWSWLQLKNINIETLQTIPFPRNIIRIQNKPGGTPYFFNIQDNPLPPVSPGPNQPSRPQFSLKITYEGNTKHNTFITKSIILKNGPLEGKATHIRSSLGLITSSPVSLQNVKEYIGAGSEMLMWDTAVELTQNYQEWKKFMENENPHSAIFNTIPNFPDIPGNYGYIARRLDITQQQSFDVDMFELYILPMRTNLYKLGYMKKLITKETKNKVYQFFNINNSIEYRGTQNDLDKVVSCCDWFSFVSKKRKTVPTHIYDDFIEVFVENYTDESCFVGVCLSYTLPSGTRYIRYRSPPITREIKRPVLLDIIPASIKKEYIIPDSCKNIKRVMIHYLESRRYNDILSELNKISSENVQNVVFRENIEYLEKITKEKLEDIEKRITEENEINKKGIQMTKIMERFGRKLLGEDQAKKLEEELKRRSPTPNESFLEKEKYGPQRLLERELKKKRRIMQLEEKEFTDEEEDDEKIKEKIEELFKTKRKETYRKIREMSFRQKEGIDISGSIIKKEDKERHTLYDILGYNKENVPTFSENIQEAIQRFSEGLTLDYYIGNDPDEEDKRLEKFKKEIIQSKYKKLTEEAVLVSFLEDTYEGIAWLNEKKEKKRREYFKILYGKELTVLENKEMEKRLRDLQRKWLESYGKLTFEDKKERNHLFLELKGINLDDVMENILQKQKNRALLSDSKKSYHRDTFTRIENIRYERLKNFISTLVLVEKTGTIKEITIDDYKQQRRYYRKQAEENKYKVNPSNYKKTPEEMEIELRVILDQKREEERKYETRLMETIRLYSAEEIKKRLKDVLDMRIWLMQSIRSNIKKEKAQFYLQHIEIEIDMLEIFMNQKLTSELLLSQKINSLQQKKEEAENKYQVLQEKGSGYFRLFSASLTKEEEEEKIKYQNIISGEYLRNEIDDIRYEYYRSGILAEEKRILMFAYDIVYPIGEQKDMDKWIDAHRAKIEKEWGNFVNYRAYRKELLENGLDLPPVDLQYFNKMEERFLETKEDISERSKRLRYLRMLRYPSKNSKISITPDEEEELSFLESEDHLYPVEHQENEEHLQHLMEKNMLGMTDDSVDLLIKIKKMCDFLTIPNKADRDCDVFAKEQKSYLEKMGFNIFFFQNEQNKSTYNRILKKYKNSFGGAFYYNLNVLRKLRTIKYASKRDHLNPCDEMRLNRLQKKVEKTAGELEKKIEEIKSRYSYYRSYSAEDKKEIEESEAQLRKYREEVENQIKEENAYLLFSFDNSFEKLKKFKKDVDDMILLQKVEEKKIDIPEEEYLFLRQKKEQLGYSIDLSYFEKENRAVIYDRLEKEYDTISSKNEKIDRWIELADIKKWDAAFFTERYGKEWMMLSDEIKKDAEDTIKKLKDLEWNKKLRGVFVSKNVQEEIEMLKKLMERVENLEQEKTVFESDDMMAAFGNSFEELKKARSCMKRLMFLDGKVRTEIEENEYQKLLALEKELSEKGVDRNYFFKDTTTIQAYQKIKEKLYKIKGGKMQYFLEKIENLRQKKKKEVLTTAEEIEFFESKKKAMELYQKIYYSLFQLSFWNREEDGEKITMLTQMVNMYIGYSHIDPKSKPTIDDKEANEVWESYGKNFERLWMDKQYCKDLKILKNMENASIVSKSNASVKIQKIIYYTENTTLHYDDFDGDAYKRYLIIRNTIFGNASERFRFKLNLLRNIRNRKYGANEKLSKEDSYMLEKLEASVSKQKNKIEKKYRKLCWMASTGIIENKKEWEDVENMVKEYLEEDRKQLNEEAEWMKNCWEDLGDIKDYINHLNPNSAFKIEAGSMKMKVLVVKYTKFSEKDLPFPKPFNTKRNVEVYNYLKDRERLDRSSHLYEADRIRLFLLEFIHIFLEDWGLTLTDRMQSERLLHQEQNTFNSDIIHSYCKKAKEQNAIQMKELSFTISQLSSSSEELNAKYAKEIYYENLRNKKYTSPILNEVLAKRDIELLQEKIKYASSLEISQHFEQLLFLREFLEIFPSAISREYKAEWLSRAQKEIDFFIPWMKNYWQRESEINSVVEQLNRNLVENHQKIASLMYASTKTKLSKDDTAALKSHMNFEMVENQIRHMKSKITQWMHNKYNTSTTSPLSYEDRINLKGYKKYLKNNVVNYIRENILVMNAQSFETSSIKYDKDKIDKALDEIIKNVQEYFLCLEFIKYPVFFNRFSDNFGLLKTEREHLLQKKLDFKPSKLKSYSLIKYIFYKKVDASFFMCDDNLKKETVYANPFYYLSWLNDPLYKKDNLIDYDIPVTPKKDDGDLLKASPKYREYETTAFYANPTRAAEIKKYWERLSELLQAFPKEWIQVQDIPPNKKYLKNEIELMQNTLDELLDKTAAAYLNKDRIIFLRDKQDGKYTDDPITPEEKIELEQIELAYLYEEPFFDILESYNERKIVFVDEQKLKQILEEETAKIEKISEGVGELAMETQTDSPSTLFENPMIELADEEEAIFDFAEDASVSDEVELVDDSDEVELVDDSNEVELVDDSDEVELVDDSNEVELVDDSNEVELVDDSDEVELVDDSNEVELVDDSNEVELVDDSNEVELVDDSNEVELVDDSNEVELVDDYVENDEARYIKNILPSNITKNINEKMQHIKWFYYFAYKPLVSYPILLEKTKYIKNVSYHSPTDKIMFEGSECMNDQYRKYVCYSEQLPYHLYHSFRTHYLPSLPEKEFSNVLLEEHKIENDMDPDTAIYFTLSGDTSDKPPRLYKIDGVEHSAINRFEYEEIKKISSNPIEDFIWDYIISGWNTYGPELKKNIVKNIIAPNGLRIHCDPSQTKPNTHCDITVMIRTPYFFMKNIKLFDMDQKDLIHIMQNFNLEGTCKPPPITVKTPPKIVEKITKTSPRSSSRTSSKSSSRTSSKSSSRTSSKSSSRSSSKSPKSSSRSSSRSSTKTSLPQLPPAESSPAKESSLQPTPCKNGYVKKINAKGVPYYLDKRGKRVSAEIGKKHCS
jgi:hypothetical protein